MTGRQHAASGLRELFEREFDADWYVQAYPEVIREIGRGFFIDPLDHYVRTGHAEGRSPSAEFDEAYYLEAYADVAQAVRAGALSCCFQHFLLYGRDEKRSARRPADIVCTVDAIRGNLIDGWAANMSDPGETIELELYLDDRLLIGRVRADTPRRDLLSLLPTVDRGFVFPVPLAYCDGIPRQIAIRDSRGRRMSVREGRGGTTLARVTFAYRHDQGLSAALLASDKLDDIAAKLEQVRAELAFVRRLASFPLGDYDYYYRNFYALSAAEIAVIAEKSERLLRRPTFSVVMPVCDTKASFLDAAIRSVQAQAYPVWELCIADDASRDEGTREVIRSHALRDPRIKFVFAEENGGPARNTNRAIALATGDYVALLNHDDLLAPDALYTMALAVQTERYELLYSDEDLIDEQGRHLRPHLKPDYNYDYSLALNYLCHLLVLDRRLLSRLNGFREGYDGCQDRDLVLRAAALCGRAKIRHVPKVLYHWRVNPTSLSASDQNRSAILAQSVDCVQDHLDHTETSAVATPGDPALFSCRVRWPLPEEPPKVSIIIPTRDRLDLLGPCVASLLERTGYRNLELVIVDHESAEVATRAYLDILKQDPRVRVFPYSGVFNWAALNNFGAERATGSVLCFLNNDVLVFDPTWLEELVAHAVRPNVGVVGAKLLYENGTVQHGGVVLGIGGYAGHAFQHLSPTDAGYLGRAGCAQEVSAVTGACLMCRKDVFDEVAGFDAAAFAVALNDVDFCLRVRDAGYDVVWTPHSVLYHFESRSRGYDDESPEKRQRLAEEATALRRRWGHLLDQDPHYNPHFDLMGAPYERLVIPKKIWTEEDLARAAPFVPRARPRSDASAAVGERREPEPLPEDVRAVARPS